MKNGSQIAIVGVGETEFRRRHDRHVASLVVEAARAAIDESGLKPEDIDGFISPRGQPPADEVALGVGATRRRYTTTNAYTPGAGPLAAIVEAKLAIDAGLATAVLVTYGVQTSAPGGPYAFHATDSLKADLEMPVGYYGQPVYFAMLAARYRHLYGLEPRQLGALAVAQRHWASMTPGAQRPERITMEDYLASPMVAEPLHTLDCCLISDGAGAYVVTSAERARDLAKPPAIVAGIASGSNRVTLTEMFTQNPDFLELAPQQSAGRAFEQAGVGREDIDFAEVYDCFTISVLLQLEGLGFCGIGEAGGFVEDGRTGPGGALPINTHGGHLSHAYIPAVTHVIEAVRQIRGERGEAQVPGAQVGLVSTFGGPDHATLILTADGVSS